MYSFQDFSLVEIFSKVKGTDVQLGRVFRGREIPRRIMSVRQEAAVRSWRFVLDAVFDPSRCASLDAASID